jgi:hypothetical protein
MMRSVSMIPGIDGPLLLAACCCTLLRSQRFAYLQRAHLPKGSPSFL